MSRPGFEIILIGGRLSGREAGSVGESALFQLQHVKVDLCFLGSCTVDTAEGVACIDADDAEVKRAMVESSRRVALTISSETLLTKASFFIAPAPAIHHLILDSAAPTDRVDEFRKICADVKLVRL